MKKLQNLFIAFVLIFSLSSGSYAQEKAIVVKLEETPGQFETKSLALKAGKYQFDVTNKNVDHEVAFFLQAEADKNSKEFSTALPNSGLPKTLKKGESAQTGIVELKKGTYVYSCPLNPTPKYVVTVVIKTTRKGLSLTPTAHFLFYFTLLRSDKKLLSRKCKLKPNTTYC